MEAKVTDVTPKIPLEIRGFSIMGISVLTKKLQGLQCNTGYNHPIKL